MQCVLKVYLDGIAITKLPTLIVHLTGLALLNVRDCNSLTCLPSTLFNLKLLKRHKYFWMLKTSFDFILNSKKYLRAAA